MTFSARAVAITGGASSKPLPAGRVVLVALFGMAWMAHVAAAGMPATLTGSTTTFEMPDGWKRASATSETPSAILWLCREGSEPQPNDECTIRAELYIGQKREFASLDAKFAEWQALAADTIVSPARRFSIADRDAIEVVTKGQMTHVPGIVFNDTVALKAGADYYECNLKLFDVSDYMALQGVVQSLCGSIRTAPQTSG